MIDVAKPTPCLESASTTFALASSHVEPAHRVAARCRVVDGRGGKEARILAGAEDPAVERGGVVAYSVFDL